jgi:hypothetical protein
MNITLPYPSSVLCCVLFFGLLCWVCWVCLLAGLLVCLLAGPLTCLLALVGGDGDMCARDRDSQPAHDIVAEKTEDQPEK